MRNDFAALRLSEQEKGCKRAKGYGVRLPPMRLQVVPSNEGPRASRSPFRGLDGDQGWMTEML